MPLLGNPSCKLCDRGQSAPLICVMGTGPTDAKIMVVGEAPTIHRKDLTRAFSGNAGKLLDRMLIELGQARDTMYLTNAVHCLYKHTIVQTEKGNKFIQDIVEEKWDGKVKSVDAEGNLVWKKIVEWYKNPRSNRKLYKISFVSGKSHHKGTVGAVATEDHPILTKRGYIATKDLKDGDFVATGYPVPGPKAEQVILGSLLGDGNISKKGRFNEKHSIKQKEYLQHKVQLFTPFLEKYPGISRKTPGGKETRGRYPQGSLFEGRPRTQFHYTLSSNYYFGNLRRKWYPNKIKKTPLDLHRILNVFGVAIWYMDDGTYSVRKKFIRFSLGNRTEEDAKYLQSILKNLGFKSRRSQSSRGSWHLWLNTEVTKKFLLSVAKYVPESMRYKLNEEALKIPFDPSCYEPEEAKTGWGRVKVTPYTPKRRTINSVYCIDVEDTHNFCTPGGIVHNCAAPENDSPSNSQIKACKTYIEQEISEVKPKFVLLLGAVALKSVLGKTGITELHGHPIEKEGVIYYPIFHPAAALRDISKTDVIKADLKKFFEIVEGTWKPSTGLNLSVIKSFEDVNNMVADLKDCRVIGLDLETSGLDPFDPQGFITILGISRYKNEALTDEKQYAVPFTLPNSPFLKKEIQKQIVELVIEATKGKKIVGHNIKFDNLWLHNQYGIRLRPTVDTMLLAHILDENAPVGLKYLAGVHLGAPNYDLTSEEKRGDVETRRLLEYNGYDTMFTLRLYKFLRERLMKEPGLLKLFMYLIMPLSRTFEEIEIHGTYVYTERLEELEELLEGRLTVAQAGLDELAQGVNWASPRQVAEVLFGRWGLKPLETTKSGVPSTAESILLRLRHQHKGVDLLLQHREVSKQLSSFVEGWASFIRDSRMHPSFKIHGTVTGRLSCSSPNLMQVPRDTKIRSLIGAPPGWKLLEGDLSQIELRIAAILSKDPTMIEIFNNASDDIHRRTASKITGKPPEQITKEERKKAKACFSGDTEILTKTGWVRFDRYNGKDQVAQYDLNNEEIGFTVPLSFQTQNNRELILFENENNSLLVTPDHELIFIPRHTGPRDPFKGRARKVQALSLEGKRGALVNAGYYKNTPKISELETRLIAAVASDGYIREDREDIRFRLVKARKIDRLKSLLNKAGVLFNERITEKEVTSITISDKKFYCLITRYLSADKTLSWEVLEDLHPKTYLEEAGEWDAWKDDVSFKKTHIRFNTHNLITGEIMQAMGALSGIRIVLWKNPPRRETSTEHLVFSYNPEGKTLSHQKRISFERQPGRHLVYCVQVPWGGILVRRNMKISIQGNCNFGFLYGMSSKKFAEYARDKYDTILTPEEAAAFRDTFFHTYAGLLPWHARQRSLVKQFMQVKSLDGRIRHLPEIMSPADEIRSQAERNAVNSPVQGLASDLNCMALVEIHETLPRDKIRVIGAVHDAILAEVREDYIEEALIKVKAIMEHPKLLDKFGIEFPIPIISEVKVSKGWGLDE